MSSIANICQLADIGEWRMTRKTELVLTGRRISQIPDDVGNLTGMQALKISNNELTCIPDTIGGMTSLSLLDVQTNMLSSVPESLSRLNSLKVVDLSGNRLTSLPDSMFVSGSITSLSIANNQIVDINPSIAKCRNLASFNASSNKIQQLPVTFSHLNHLQELFLNANEILFLPESLSALSSLEKLHVQDNQIAVLPFSISKLTNLKELNASNNQIFEISYSLALLPKLKVLMLAQNKISCIPEYISLSKSLELLEVSGNQVVDILESLKRLPFIKKGRDVSKLIPRQVSVADISFYTDRDMKDDAERLARALNRIPTPSEMAILSSGQRLRVAQVIEQVQIDNLQQHDAKNAAFESTIEQCSNQLAILWPRMKSLLHDLEEAEHSVKTHQDTLRLHTAELKRHQSDVQRYGQKPEQIRTLADRFLAAWRTLDEAICKNDVAGLSREQIRELFLWQELHMVSLVDLEQRGVHGADLSGLVDPNDWPHYGIEDVGDYLRMTRVCHALSSHSLSELGAVRTRSLSQSSRSGKASGSSSVTKDWGIDQICKWLHSCELGQLVPFFVQQRIDGRLLALMHHLLSQQDPFITTQVTQGPFTTPENPDAFQKALEQLYTETQVA
eukprot:TRINITY_DN4441_c0_g1_i6.p1 TRINITY_DN4441_c0_g1~~TRINITY_DN4441_c0_g1_i6.p1  ORF type:complete len:618 (-),score=146.05 TRINITY_DN4441_c0_g1_i6:194-2047(-)